MTTIIKKLKEKWEKISMETTIGMIFFGPFYPIYWIARKLINPNWDAEKELRETAETFYYYSLMSDYLKVRDKKIKRAIARKFKKEFGEDITEAIIKEVM